MDYQLSRLNQVIKSFDRELFAKRVGEQVQIHRKSVQNGDATVHLILALTHNWLAHGKPVEWGLEPILQRLLSMDSWRNDSIYSDMVKDRESAKYWEERERKNNSRAMALDIRKDFAKSTNDINTSTCK